MNSDGTGITQLTSTGMDRAPKWSPDGKRIGFTSTRDGATDAFVMNADGTAATNLTGQPLGAGHDAEFAAWAR